MEIEQLRADLASQGCDLDLDFFGRPAQRQLPGASADFRLTTAVISSTHSN